MNSSIKVARIYEFSWLINIVDVNPIKKLWYSIIFLTSIHLNLLQLSPKLWINPKNLYVMIMDFFFKFMKSTHTYDIPYR